MKRLEASGAVRLIYRSLGFKGLIYALAWNPHSSFDTSPVSVLRMMSFCVLCYYLVCIFVTSCVLFYYVCVLLAYIL